MMKQILLENTKFRTVNIVSILLIFILIACGSNDAQREFEQEAFRQPAGITETNDRGEILNEDTDDWRISPFFQALVEVTPAFPNPVSTTGQLQIEVSVLGIESVNGLEVAELFEDGSINTLFTDATNPLPAGIQVVPVNPNELGRFEAETRGLHRILIFDLRRNIISYGDVRVQ